MTYPEFHEVFSALIKERKRTEKKAPQATSDSPPKTYGDPTIPLYETSTDRQIERIAALMTEIIDVIGRQNAQIRRLQDATRELSTEIYRLAPELDTIECVADEEDPEEAEMMRDLYLNHNMNYFDDLEDYKRIVEGVRKTMSDVSGTDELVTYEEIRGITLPMYQEKKRAEND